jgi:hypothetical protein
MPLHASIHSHILAAFGMRVYLRCVSRNNEIKAVGVHRGGGDVRVKSKTKGQQKLPFLQEITRLLYGY